MNQLHVSKLHVTLPRIVYLSQVGSFSRTILIWGILAAIVIGQEPETDTPPVANSTTILVIGLDAKLNESEFASSSEFLKSLSPGTSAYMSFDAPFGKQHASGRAVFKASRTTEGSRAANKNGLTIITSEPNKTYLGGGPPTSSQTRRLRAAEASIQQYPLRCLFVPPDYISDTFEQTLPTLPEALGSLPTRTLTQGIRWAALGLNPKTQKLEATIQSASPEDAKALEAAFPKLLPSGLSLVQDRVLAKFLTLVSRDATLRVVESQLHVTFEKMSSKNRSATMTQLAVTLLGGEQHRYTRDKLRKIQLAILNYESANGCFPPSENVRGDDGKSGLSWRVHVLPYFGAAEAKLYSEFRLDEPWDSAHNKTLLKRMPDCYRNSNSWLEPETAGSDTVFLAPAGRNTVLGTGSVVRFKDVEDGSSVTLSVVEVDKKSAVRWTAPNDYRYDNARPAAKLAFSKDGIGLGVTCDGRVHDLKKDWDAEMYLRLFQRDDAQTVRW